MDEVSFSFNGKRYEGNIVCSDKMEPYYYWFINKDQELIDKLGEDVAFVLKEEGVKPLNYTLAEKYPELFNRIIAVIEKNISPLHTFRER